MRVNTKGGTVRERGNPATPVGVVLRLALCFSLLATMMGVGGCSTESNRKDNQLLQQQFVDYLREKYGIAPGSDYHILNVSYRNFAQGGFDQMMACLAGSDYEEYDRFAVQRYTQEDGTYGFRDNYFHFIIRDDAIAYGQQIADKYFSTSKIFYWNSTNTMSDSLGRQSTLEDLFAVLEASRIGCGNFWIFVEDEFENEDEFRNAAEQFSFEMDTVGLSSMDVFLIKSDTFRQSETIVYYRGLVGGPKILARFVL